MSKANRKFVPWMIVATLFVAGTRAGAQPTGRAPARPEVRGVVKVLDPSASTITVAAGEGRPAAGEKTYSLAKDVEVAYVAGSGLGRSSVFAEGKLADVGPGSTVSLTLSPDGKTVESILAEGPVIRGRLESADAGKKTVTLSLPPGRGEQPEGNKTYSLAEDVEVAADDGLGRIFSIREAKLPDLVPRSFVTLRLSPGGKVVVGILAEGMTLSGNLKAADGEKRTVTVLLGSGREEKTLDVDPKALTLVDDGRGRRLSIKKVALKEIPVGAALSLRLSTDQKAVVSIRAEGATVSGRLSAVDVNKGTVTLSVRGARGAAPEEKTWVLSKDARIQVDGKEGKFSDLKTGDGGHFVMLRLSLDQKMANSVTAVQGR